MIRFRTLLPLLLLLCAATLSGCASSRSALPSEWDGLVLQPGTRLGAVFVKPDAEIASYTSVMLDPVEVSFARNWDPNRGGRSAARRLNASDITAMQTGIEARLDAGLKGMQTSIDGLKWYVIITGSVMTFAIALGGGLTAWAQFIK